MEGTWKTAGRAVARRLFLDRQARYWAGRLGRAPGACLARVVDVIDETPDTKSFLLRPNGRWQGHRAGQYTTVELEIDGVRQRRCYSLSSAPSEELLRITVKEVAGGRVSRWLHQRLRRGDRLLLGAAAGDFVLPDPLPSRLLLLGGGSGITPLMAMLRELDGRRAVGDVVLVNYARRRDELIFHASLEALAARHAGLSIHFCLDDDPGAKGGFDETRLAERVPDFAERDTYLCGPAGMMVRVERMWQAAGARERLRSERFAAPTTIAPPRAAGTCTVRLAGSGRSHHVSVEHSLLDGLERAGERPPHGCRIGICHGCRCNKRSGTVQNLITGAVSSQPDEAIQLCISVAVSDLELGL
jgi:ferredoxin-NADP reductase